LSVVPIRCTQAGRIVETRIGRAEAYVAAEFVGS
jgi:hypothetical protein